MSISIAGFRAHKTRLLIALALSAIACSWFTLTPAEPPLPVIPPVPATYDVVPLQNEPLPPGVDSNPAQFRVQTGMRDAGPTHRHRRLGTCAGCIVEVDIVPLGDTREVNPDSASSAIAPATGRAVAKIVNRHATNAEGMYGFRPLSEFEYYVWADTAGSPARARMFVLEVPAVGQPGNVRVLFRKNLQLCAHDPLPPAGSDADFRFCEGVYVSTGLTLNRAGMLPIAPLAVLVSRLTDLVAGKSSAAQAPIWLRCRDGCCG